MALIFTPAFAEADTVWMKNGVKAIDPGNSKQVCKARLEAADAGYIIVRHGAGRQ